MWVVQYLARKMGSCAQQRIHHVYFSPKMRIGKKKKKLATTCPWAIFINKRKINQNPNKVLDREKLSMRLEPLKDTHKM